MGGAQGLSGSIPGKGKMRLNLFVRSLVYILEFAFIWGLNFLFAFWSNEGKQLTFLSWLSIAALKTLLPHLVPENHNHLLDLTILCEVAASGPPLHLWSAGTGSWSTLTWLPQFSLCARHSPPHPGSTKSSLWTSVLSGPGQHGWYCPTVPVKSMSNPVSIARKVDTFWWEGKKSIAFFLVI